MDMSSFHAGETTGFRGSSEGRTGGAAADGGVDGDSGGGVGLFNGFAPGLEGLLSEYSGGYVEKWDMRWVERDVAGR